MPALARTVVDAILSFLVKALAFLSEDSWVLLAFAELPGVWFMQIANCKGLTMEHYFCSSEKSHESSYFSNQKGVIIKKASCIV